MPFTIDNFFTENPIGTSPPEGQYQDEFYLSVFHVTNGNVRISPEFASATGADMVGRIDFFIQMGDRNNTRRQPTSRTSAFSKLGRLWADYILLDCRMNVPQVSHPSTNSSSQSVPVLIILQRSQNLSMLYSGMIFKRLLCMTIS